MATRDHAHPKIAKDISGNYLVRQCRDLIRQWLGQENDHGSTEQQHAHAGEAMPVDEGPEGITTADVRPSDMQWFVESRSAPLMARSALLRMAFSGIGVEGIPRCIKRSAYQVGMTSPARYPHR